MTHGQRACAHDASGLTLENAIMANYNSGNLPKGVASGLADTVKAVNESQPDLSEVTVTLWGEVTATVTRKAAYPKRTLPVDWETAFWAVVDRLPENVAAARVREVLVGVASGHLTPSNRVLDPETAAQVAAINAAKPRVMLPGQRTVKFGAVEINIASTLPAMRAE
jgi:hypothetical protein